jgi:2-hydroxychromene-2-carboxylate isomerase
MGEGAMGELIDLAQRREAVHRMARRREPLRAQLFFDLACPFSYLAAERVERAFAHVAWTAASPETLQRRCLADDPERVDRVRAAAELRAAALRMPLVWPDGFPRQVPAAMRAAAFAAEQGRGGAFVLAAGRLAFCGGFDLDDPEILAEAAAAAGIRLEHCLRAAGDPRRDGAAEAAGRKLLAAGADRLPVLRVGRALFWGEQRVGAAAASVRQATPALARRG